MDSVLGMVLPYDRKVDMWGEDKQRMEYALNVLLPEVNFRFLTLQCVAINRPFN